MIEKDKNDHWPDSRGALAQTTNRHIFPGGKKFAFSVLDDTDFSTIKNVGPVYKFLLDIGVRTSKSVWVLDGEPAFGLSLQHRQYCEFVRSLQARGVEVALHNVQNSTANRERTMLGLSRFADILGDVPAVHCNHESNHENLYWGSSRLRSNFNRMAYKAAVLFRDRVSTGHIENTPYFWGDLSQQHIKYVRNFVYDETNLDLINPSMPYHDPYKPWVNAWFSSSDGEDVDRFCRLISEENQDRLEEQGGVCIIYSHFAYGFSRYDGLHPKFERLMRRLADKDGWFVPVSELLDHLRAECGSDSISDAELSSMESRWLAEKFQRGARRVSSKIARIMRGDFAPGPDDYAIPVVTDMLASSDADHA